MPPLLSSGIKPRQRSAGRPPPSPQVPGDADAGLRRPRKGWRAGVLLAPDVGIATCALLRGALALAAVTAAPVVTHCRPPPDKLGGRGGGRRGNRGGHCRPGGRGGRRGNRGGHPLPAPPPPINWEVGGAAAAVAAVTHCRPPPPDKLGGEEGLRFRRRAWCRNIQYGGPCEGGSANFQRRGAGECRRVQASPGEAGRGRAEAGRPRPWVILGPDRGRPAGRWHGLRQGAAQDADVGGRQDARPPARARPGGAGRVQARPGEGRRGRARAGAARRCRGGWRPRR